MNDVTEQRRLQLELTQSEKMSSLGQMISGVAHELNNPLASIVGFAQLVRAAADSTKTPERLEIIAREAERCRRIVRSLLSFARRHEPERAPLSLNQVVHDVANLLRYQLRSDGVTLDEPVVAFDGLAGPEGLDIRHNVLYVVEGASQELTSIHLKSGKRQTIATDLGLQGPFIFPFGYLNNVTVSDNNQIFVNADRRNVIYEF